MQTINYLIVDGDVNGRIKCSIDESTIIAYRISRKHLSKGVDDFDRESKTRKKRLAFWRMRRRLYAIYTINIL